MQNQNRVEAAKLRVKSAELGQKIAQSAYFPTVGLGGSLQTNYSNKGFDITGTDQVINFTDVVINGQNVSVGFPSSIPIFEKTPYFNQVTDNLSYGIGMNVSIPIYSNYNARAGVQRSKINTDLANLNFEQIKDNLKIEVSQALNDAKAAKSRYRAAEKSKIASENLYKNTKKRYDIGSAGTFELIQNKTLLDNAIINETISKFDYIFRTKILEFYLGLPLTL